jgi:hypothetical protein
LANRWDHIDRHRAQQKNDSLLWDALRHTLDHIQTHTTQQGERPVTKGYTGA